MAANPTLTADIREDFIRAAVSGNPITLKELAARHCRSYPALRKAASDGKWSEKAAAAKIERDAKVAERVSEQNILTAAMIDEAVGREVDVRVRHTMLARTLQRMALERLLTMCLEDLSPTLALHMLRIGIEAERVALGLREPAQSLCERPMDSTHQLEDAVQAASAILKRHSRSLNAS